MSFKPMDPRFRWDCLLGLGWKKTYKSSRMEGLDANSFTLGGQAS